MQERHEKQAKDLYLDYFSWGLPIQMSAAGLGPSSRYKEVEDGKSDKQEKTTKKGKGKKGGKGKDKASMQVEQQLTKEEQRQLDLQKIAQAKRDLEISNLWPEPSTKIFIGPKTSQASKRQEKP